MPLVLEISYVKSRHMIIEKNRLMKDNRGIGAFFLITKSIPKQSPLSYPDHFAYYTYERPKNKPVLPVRAVLDQ